MLTLRMLNPMIVAIAGLTTACVTDSTEPKDPDERDPSTDAAASPPGDGGTQPAYDEGGPKPDVDAAPEPESDASSDHTGQDPTTEPDGSTDSDNDSDSGEPEPPDAGAGQDGGPVPSPDDIAANRFFMPTGEEVDNTSAPRLEVDRQGGLHAVYPAYAGGDAYYAYCPADCTGPSDVSVVRFPTDGTVANAMLALTQDGAPRVLLSSYQFVYFASCDEDCTDADNWKLLVILDHDSEQEVTGEALAIDPDGNPHFILHTYRAFLGIGQQPPKTFYASCYADDCLVSDAWQYDQISEQIWEDSHLKFDDSGRAHLAMVANVVSDDAPTELIAGYATCADGCDDEANWPAVGLAYAYSSETEAVAVAPSVSLALTSEGNPRVLALAVTEDGAKNLDYFECDSDCTGEGFQGIIVSEHSAIGAGIDLALDALDRPRLVYTLDYNIGLAYCDDMPCAGDDASWGLTPVELGSDMPPDEIFPYANCSVSAWFLHGPSLALDANGAPRVGYQARDISGGWQTPSDPTQSPCVAGTDMTWTRLAVMASYRD